MVIMKKEKIVNGLTSFLAFALWMLVFGLFVRLFEAVVLTHYQGDFLSHIVLNVKGLCYDIFFFLRISLPLLAVYLLLHFFSPKAAKWVFAIGGALALLISQAMIMYFVSALIPLDRVFFDYSLSEIVHIAGSTGSFVWWSYVCLVAIPVLFALVMLRSKIKVHWAFLIVYAVFVVAVLVMPWPPAWLYNKRAESYEVVNKQRYFFKSLMSAPSSHVSISNENIEACRDNIVQFQSMFPENDFVDIHHPLAHTDKSPDVLSGFFDLDSTRMPNLVFVITEGLSREFSGYNSELPSATPFLDSLAENSLTWVNCMSSSQRTIAVLPTLFGSLPFGKRGFMQSSDCPQFYSLPSILKQNGYNTSFFYGGWLAFDNTLYFLRDMGVENYLPDHTTYPETMRNTWGLLDEHTFSESFKCIDFASSKPHLDIYLTLSTHDPFEYPDKENYTMKYSAKLKAVKSKLPAWQHDQYASYLYFDDCLRKFFEAYKTKPGYENTIFIITGDHCFNSRSEELTRYHVPLVVWSPMLKQAKRFPAMAAHRDVTPTLLAMFRDKYSMKTPEIVSWVNTGLDTASIFEAKTFTPQLKESRTLENMVYHNYFYDNGDVYELSYENDRLKATPSQNDEIVDLMHNYIAIDDYVMNNNALIMSGNGSKEVLMEVDSANSVAYVAKRTGVSPADTLGKSGVFVLKNEFPFSVYSEESKEGVEAYVVHCEFDVYQPKIDDGGELHFNIAVKNKKVMKDYLVNYYDYDYYDCWTHVSMTQTINTTLAEMGSDDVLQIYFWNRGKHEFYMSNFRAKVEVSKE